MTPALTLEILTHLKLEQERLADKATEHRQIRWHKLHLAHAAALEEAIAAVQTVERLDRGIMGKEKS